MLLIPALRVKYSLGTSTRALMALKHSHARFAYVKLKHLSG